MPCVPALVRWMNGLAAEIDRGDFERRVPVIEGVRRLPPDFAHANSAAFGRAQRQRFLDRTDHDDPRSAVRQGDGGGREGAEYVNNPYRAIPAGSAFEQALNRDFHRGL